MISGFLLGSILFAYEIPLLVRHIDIREVSFSLIVPVKSHLKRSVVTFGCFGIVAFIGNWSLEIKLGIWLLSLVVIYKHVTAAELEIKKENWRTR